eukprot:915389-Rhodomonas_salina.2
MSKGIAGARLLAGTRHPGNRDADVLCVVRMAGGGVHTNPEHTSGNTRSNTTAPTSPSRACRRSCAWCCIVLVLDPRNRKNAQGVKWPPLSFRPTPNFLKKACPKHAPQCAHFPYNIGAPPKFCLNNGIVD